MCLVLHPELRVERDERKVNHVVYRPRMTQSALEVTKNLTEDNLASSIPASVTTSLTEIPQIFAKQNLVFPLSSSMGKESDGTKAAMMVGALCQVMYQLYSLTWLLLIWSCNIVQ